jgi:hypothetical protein
VGLAKQLMGVDANQRVVRALQIERRASVLDWPLWQRQ